MKRNQQTYYILVGFLGPDTQTACCGQAGLCVPGLGEKEKTNQCFKIQGQIRILNKIQKADAF